MDLSFYIFDDFGLSVLFTVSIFFFSMVGVMDSFTTVLFVLVSLIPSSAIFYLVVTNDFLEDMISVLDFLYPVYYKTKVILPAISISVYPRPQQSTMLNKSPVVQRFPPKENLSHKPDQISRSWNP